MSSAQQYADEIDVQAQVMAYVSRIHDQSEEVDPNYIQDTEELINNPFESAMYDLQLRDDTTRALYLGLKRSQDLQKAQTKMKQDLQTERERVAATRDTTRRQGDLNEYEYQRREHAVYILRVVALMVSFFLLFTVAHRYGFIDDLNRNMLYAIVLTLGVIYILVNLVYNKYTRSKNFWNRRRWITPKKPKTVCVRS